MERTGAIYVLTNTVNGKAYVGQTWATPETRWSQHVKQAKRPVHPIAHAIRKHGAGAFTMRVLVDLVRDQSLLDVLEMDAVATFGTMLGQGGYNATSGGVGRGVLSEETKRKISIAQTGKKRPFAKTRKAGEFKMSDAAKAKISAYRTGRKMPERTEGHRSNLSASVSKLWADPEKARLRREAIARFWASPESQKRREAASRYWSDPANVAARNEKLAARKASGQHQLLN